MAATALHGAGAVAAAPYVSKGSALDAPTVVFSPKTVQLQGHVGTGSSGVSSGWMDACSVDVDAPGLPISSSCKTGTHPEKQFAVDPAEGTQRRAWTMSSLAIENAQSSHGCAVDGRGSSIPRATSPGLGRKKSRLPGQFLSAGVDAHGGDSSGGWLAWIAKLPPPRAAAVAAAASAAAQHAPAYARVPPCSDHALSHPRSAKPAFSKLDAQAPTLNARSRRPTRVSGANLGFAQAVGGAAARLAGPAVDGRNVETKQVKVNTENLRVARGYPCSASQDAVQKAQAISTRCGSTNQTCFKFVATPQQVSLPAWTQTITTDKRFATPQHMRLQAPVAVRQPVAMRLPAVLAPRGCVLQPNGSYNRAVRYTFRVQPFARALTPLTVVRRTHWLPAASGAE